ncbi:WXG100 family type VII secretion target [Paenibacillus aurantiacus]|uniref:ESAT-6-like protein n=1 Tax=Paenibacillus aurantiacus TaxID=1936118 RepID=A0ABV5KID6_9BACL
MANKAMRVETTTLKKSAEFIEDKTAKYEAEYNKIYTEIENLRVSWSGQSSDALNKQLAGYKNDFQELAKVLKEYAKHLKTTAEKIEKTEESLKNAASKLNAGR